ncbi:hypothetical protein SUGI_0301970 [Cryptomeria japonica]|nr:hypothetical protein SUGI_0301970 [Cryptomeria japonica]
MIAIPGLRKKKKMTFYYGRISSNRRSPGFNHAMSSSIANIGELCTEGWLKEAANILLTMQNPRIDVSPYLKILQTCIAGSSPLEDKSTHFFVRRGRRTRNVKGQELLKENRKLLNQQETWFHRSTSIEKHYIGELLGLPDLVLQWGNRKRMRCVKVQVSSGMEVKVKIQGTSYLIHTI